MILCGYNFKAATIMVSKLPLGNASTSNVATMEYLESINKLFIFVLPNIGFIVDLGDFSVTAITFQYLM